MTDYTASVYKLVSSHTNKVYFGVTTQPLTKRLQGHVNAYKTYKNKQHKHTYISSFELLQYDDCRIELLEKVQMYNRHSVERNYIRNNPDIAVNVTCSKKHSDNLKKKFLDIALQQMATRGITA